MLIFNGFRNRLNLRKNAQILNGTRIIRIPYILRVPTPRHSGAVPKGRKPESIPNSRRRRIPLFFQKRKNTQTLNGIRISAFLVAVIGATIIKFLRPRWLALTIALSIAVVTAFLVILNTLALANSYFGYSAFEIISVTWAYPPVMILFTLIPTKHNK